MQSQQRQRSYPDPAEPVVSVPATTALTTTTMNAAAGTGSSTGSSGVSQPRTSSASARSRSSGNVWMSAASSPPRAPANAAQPDKQISQIEKSVTHLLVATKQLLETLTQWSRGQAQEEDVSDVYVRLGYEFNLACRAFNSIGVDTADLGNVPDLLRHILEDTLSQAASPQALDHYLPRIRDIIVNLLHGLKRKQSKLRARPSRDNVAPAPAPVPASSSSSSQPAPVSDSRQERESTPTPSSSTAPAVTAPAPPSSATRRSFRRDAPIIAPSESGSSLSSSTMQALPVQSPAGERQQALQSPGSGPSYAYPPPPPPPKQHDALAALQRGGDLERRASRRFSAYQISKQLGASPNGVPVIPPPPQHSRIANRGQDYRESMKAVQSRGSTYRTRSVRKQADVSPSRSGTVRAPERIVEEEREDGTGRSDANRTRTSQPPLPTLDTSQDAAITAAKPPDVLKAKSPGADSVDTPLGPTVSGPLALAPDAYQPPTPTNDQVAAPPEYNESVKREAASTPTTIHRKPASSATPPPSQLTDPDSSPSQSKELTLFLQYKTKIKKFVLPDRDEQLTLARLQLAFIEKFAWHTHNDGLDLPEIYIQDPVSGVRHELEDLSDVKDRVVLVLNVEPLDEVKKHFDDGLGGLQKTLDALRHQLEGQGSMMQRFSDRQLEASKEMARMSALPATRPPRTPVLAQGDKSRVPTPPPSGATIQEVQNMRRDIAVLRQTYSSMAADFTAAMNDIKAKADNVKQAAADATVPTYTGDAGRAHIVTGKKQLATDSEAILNRYDDIADVIEELRRDVVTRGVRPLPRQLEDIGKELSAVAKELSRLKEVVKREKPIWTKIWEQELELVMSEKQDLTHQEEVLIDLSMDLKESTGIFQLVEEAMRQQNLQAAQQQPAGVGPAALRPTPKMLAFDSDVDPHEAKEGMLDEVRGLKINHQDRVEAIERAEKARQRELQSRKGGEFQREVEQFVGQGKLKKTGGADEVERRRNLADEKARKENWERQEQRKIEMERKRQEKAALAAAEDKDKDKGAEASEPTESTGATESIEPADVTANPRASNNTSHEGEAPFEDANEHGLVTTNNPPTEPLSKHTNDSADPAPQLPEDQSAKDDDVHPHPDSAKGKETDPDNKSANRASRSWWQPAVFT